MNDNGTVFATTYTNFTTPHNTAIYSIAHAEQGPGWWTGTPKRVAWLGQANVSLPPYFVGPPQLFSFKNKLGTLEPFILLITFLTMH